MKLSPTDRLTVGTAVWRKRLLELSADAKCCDVQTCASGRLDRLRVTMSAAVLFLLLMPVAFYGLSGSSARFATKLGEQQNIDLVDGSKVYLNTNTRVEVEDLSAPVRQVRLLTGEALFDVKHLSRPFQVVVGALVIRDIGTEFLVYEHDDTITISVLAGEVQVSSPQASRLIGQSRTHAGHSSTNDLKPEQHHGTLRMGPGDVADFQASGEQRGPVHHVKVSDLWRKLSWMEGKLSFGGEPLEQVAAEFNRYNERRIVIADPRIRGFPVGGRFTATDPLSFAQALEFSSGVRVLPPDTDNPDTGPIQLVGPKTP
jgi:transmembrane sensor